MNHAIDLRRRVDVGRRNVFVGTDDFDELRRVAARDALELALRERRGIAGDAAFAAAERQVDDRALPRHPKRERRDFIQGHARMVADAAFCRAAREIVLYAIAGVDFELAGIALEWNREDDLPRRMGEDAAHSAVEFEQIGGFVEVCDRVAEDRNVAHRGLAQSSGHALPFIFALPSPLRDCAYTLNRKFTTSPSCMTYSRPSLRTRPAARSASIV